MSNPFQQINKSGDYYNVSWGGRLKDWINAGLQKILLVHQRERKLLKGFGHGYVERMNEDKIAKHVYEVREKETGSESLAQACPTRKYIYFFFKEW